MDKVIRILVANRPRVMRVAAGYANKNAVEQIVGNDSNDSGAKLPWANFSEVF